MSDFDSELQKLVLKAQFCIRQVYLAYRYSLGE
jgi:hypothetical protein